MAGGVAGAGVDRGQDKRMGQDKSKGRTRVEDKIKGAKSNVRVKTRGKGITRRRAGHEKDKNRVYTEQEEVTGHLGKRRREGEEGEEGE